MLEHLRSGYFDTVETGNPVGPALVPDSTEIARLAQYAVPFDISSVADFLYSSGQRYWTWAEDFPCVAPPYPVVWMEYRIADNASEGAARSLYEGRTVGVLCESLRDDDGWAMYVSVFRSRGDSPEFTSSWLVRLDSDGRAQTGYPCSFRVGTPSEYRGLDPEGPVIFPVGLALSFLNCRNVTLADMPDTRTRQQRRHDARKRREPVVFKTLVIHRARQALEDEGGLSHNGLKRALHICRGHFAEYTDEKPLFGKHAGRFWIPAHVRGSLENGQVVKDYRVVA